MRPTPPKTTALKRTRASHFRLRPAPDGQAGCNPHLPRYGSLSLGWCISLVPLLGVFLFLFGSGPVRANETVSKEENLLIIGRSSLAGLDQLVGALLASHKTPMNVEAGPFGAKDLDQM